MVNNSSKLPVPQPFVPGMYKAQQAVVDSAFDGLEVNEERVLESMAALGEAQDLEARNEEEDIHELEQLLVGIFQDVDKDGNGKWQHEESHCEGGKCDEMHSVC